MRIVWLTLLLIVALNFGNPCKIGLTSNSPANCVQLADGMQHCTQPVEKP